MHPSQLNYLPLTLPFFGALVVLFLILAALLAQGIMRFASSRLGISPASALLLLFGSLVGSSINIPIARLPQREVLSGQIVNYFGMNYVVPEMVDWPGTVIAVNVGGAVIPTLLSLYLLAKNGLWARGTIAVVCVAIIVHMVATPVPGIGIAVPILTSPLASAIIAFILSPRRYAAPLAYAGGSLGTLIGADLTNLAKVDGLGAPVASIGGAGTFDGIFVAGILAMLIAGLASRSEEGHVE